MEAEARRVTNPAMLLQLRQLREAMYRGFYMMDTVGTPASRPNQWLIMHKKLCLSDGRSLIVVEIVEDVDVMAWGNLNNLLSCEVHSCSKVILISRREHVSSLGTVEAVRLARLHDEEFWYFFRVLAFGSANPYDHIQILPQ
ncbi:hypothetical protein EJB05_32134, partial [Eragrostis curvula]